MADLSSAIQALSCPFCLGGVLWDGNSFSQAWWLLASAHLLASSMGKGLCCASMFCVPAIQMLTSVWCRSGSASQLTACPPHSCGQLALRSTTRLPVDRVRTLRRHNILQFWKCVTESMVRPQSICCLVAVCSPPVCPGSLEGGTAMLPWLDHDVWAANKGRGSVH